MNRIEELRQAHQEANIPDDVPLEPGGRRRSSTAAESGTFERGKLMEEGNVNTVELTEEQEALKMDEFWTQVKEIEECLKKIKRVTEEIEKTHKAALYASNPQESQECSTKIEQLMAVANQKSNQVRSDLKSMAATTAEVKGNAKKGGGDLRLRETRHELLTRRYMQTIKALQRIQETYKHKYDEQIERQYLIVNPKATDAELAQLKSNPEAARAQLFSMTAREGAKQDLEAMKDRFDDVKLIEKSIRELAQMFLDMESIVASQSDVINAMAYNVDATEEYTAEAKADLKSAVESQKAIQKKKWIITIVVLVIVLILMGVGIYYLSKVYRNFK